MSSRFDRAAVAALTWLARRLKVDPLAEERAELKNGLDLVAAHEKQRRTEVDGLRAEVARLLEWQRRHMEQYKAAIDAAPPGDGWNALPGQRIEHANGFAIQLDETSAAWPYKLLNPEGLEIAHANHGKLDGLKRFACLLASERAAFAVRRSERRTW